MMPTMTSVAISSLALLIACIVPPTFALNNNGLPTLPTLTVLLLPANSSTYDSVLHSSAAAPILQSATLFTNYTYGPVTSNGTVYNPYNTTSSLNIEGQILQQLTLNTNYTAALYIDTTKAAAVNLPNGFASLLSKSPLSVMSPIAGHRVQTYSTTAYAAASNVTASQLPAVTYYVPSADDLAAVNGDVSAYLTSFLQQSGTRFRKTTGSTLAVQFIPTAAGTVRVPNMIYGGIAKTGFNYTLPLTAYSTAATLEDNFNVHLLGSADAAVDAADNWLAALSPSITADFGTGIAYGNGTVSPPIQHLLVMVFEDKGYTAVTTHPLWAPLIAQGTLLTNFDSLYHPSQPNYIAQISGSNFGIADSVNSYDIPYTNVVDLLEALNITWRVYADGYVPLEDGACNVQAVIGKPDTSTNATYNSTSYFRKHNPFMSFTDISDNITRCQHIVNSQQLAIDIQNNQLPQYAYYIPNQSNDGRDPNGESGPDAGLGFSGRWLTQLMDSTLKPAMQQQNLTVLISFDENDSQTVRNQIANFAVGYGVPVNGTDGTYLTTDSILKTVELNWELGSLGRNDVNASDFLHVFSNRSFVST